MDFKARKNPSLCRAIWSPSGRSQETSKMGKSCFGQPSEIRAPLERLLAPGYCWNLARGPEGGFAHACACKPLLCFLSLLPPARGGKRALSLGCVRAFSAFCECGRTFAGRQCSPEGTWCSGITPAQHAGGPGLNPQRVHAFATVRKFKVL